MNAPTKIEQMDWTPERVQRFWDYESGFPERYFAYSRSGSLMKRLKRHIRGGRCDRIEAMLSTRKPHLAIVCRVP